LCLLGSAINGINGWFVIKNSIELPGSDTFVLIIVFEIMWVCSYCSLVYRPS